MNLYIIVCKRKRGYNDNIKKVLIWLLPIRIKESMRLLWLHLLNRKKTKKQNEVLTCFFYKKTRHIKKDCVKYVAWRSKMGMILAFVCCEVNLCFAPMDTWWVDFVATLTCCTMQGCLWSRPPSDAERFIYVADDNKVAMEAVETFRLCYKTRLFLDLFEMFMYRLKDGI